MSGEIDKLIYVTYTIGEGVKIEPKYMAFLEYVKKAIAISLTCLRACCLRWMRWFFKFDWRWKY